MGFNSKTGHQTYTIAPAMSVTDDDSGAAAAANYTEAATESLLPAEAGTEPPAAPATESAEVAAATQQVADSASLPSEPAPDTGEENPVLLKDTEAAAEPEPPDMAAADQTTVTELEEQSGTEQKADPQPGVDQTPLDRWPDALIAVPEAPPEGLATGTPVLIGGEDLKDSTATLMAYVSDEGPREVLLATVSEEAEVKIFDALSGSVGKTVPVTVQEPLDGRLPVDEEEQLYEMTAKAAKSVNHKLSAQIEIPEHTQQYVTKATQALDGVINNPESTDDEVAMAKHYKQFTEAAQKVIDGEDTSKVSFVTPHEVHGTVAVTKQVPAPPEDGGLQGTQRNATRIQPKLDPVTGISSWDGVARSQSNGPEYAIDLGEGYTAVYRPHAGNGSHHEYSIRGQLEIHAPQGAGHGHELVQRLGQINLVNRPMTAAEGEWTYLRNNITAQGLESTPHVNAAVASARHLEDMQLQEIFHARSREAVGMDQAGLQRLAKEFQLEAAARCLPQKVNLVRDAVAKATGYTSGAELAAHPGYEPVPRKTAGWLTWGRFDVTTKQATVEKAFAGKGLKHSIHENNLVDMFNTGVLASTERRATMGVEPGKGWSEDADKNSGGANSVFLRVHKPHDGQQETGLFWDNPAKILNRSDFYAYKSDMYGTAKSNSVPPIRDPFEAAKLNKYSSNEVMIPHGLDLLDADAPSRIVTNSSKVKKRLLDMFASRGITHLGAKPVAEVVQ